MHVFFLIYRQIETEEISCKVLFHVMEATKFHVYSILEKKVEAAKIMANLSDSRTFKTNAEIGTINGCKTIAWLMFHEAAYKTAMPFARLAVSQGPDCPLWHLMLGKTCRHFRREGGFINQPSTVEINSYLRSYQLSKNPFYAISVAQMHKENREYNECNKICLNLYNQNPTNIVIRLRLALIFIRSKHFEQAKSCLDYVEKHSPKNSMFLHYKGLYLQKFHKDYEVCTCILL